MRKLLGLIVMMGIALTGCGIDSDISNKMKSPNYAENNSTTSNVKPSGNKGTDENEKSQIESDKIYESYMNLVNANKKPFELIAYLQREFNKVTMERADEMILALEEVQTAYENYYQQKFFGENEAKEISNAAKKGLDADIIDRAKSENMKAILKEVFAGKYKLISLEGSVYPVVDYSFLKSYNHNVSKKLSDYIEIMSEESDKAAAADGAVVISWDELSKRLLKIDEFTKKYAEFSRIEKLENLYYKYMMMYLIGLNNTPAYDYQTNKYKDDVINSFNNLISSGKGSNSAEIVAKYLEIIKKNNYIITQEARDFTSKIYNDNISPEGKYSSSMDYGHVNNSLAKLLPEKTGYKWIYNGFAEYGHQMTLEDIIKENNEIKYVIKGNVADMSGGESGKGEDHFKIDLTYTIKNASIIQTKKENIMMDSEMNSLEIIKAPLLKGNKWIQVAKDKSGKEKYLNCEITDITNIEGSKVYTVEYKDQDSDYYEKRMIQEGVGVASFVKLWKSKDGSFEIGYALNFGSFKETAGNK